ncbi:helicase RepA family protein [Vreelandella rituensis]|uniref:Replication protein A n=1 Tax=Vreelandella rituensis TaxID=2282306 RepID=A0A368TN98_9GAMM|nr:helicase RepA family protein [Halomonas rituensis]RCV86028.1 replication protein A [Halomonas rituensis]
MAIDILAAFEQEPPELDFIWPGFLSGTVGALVAPGATGKSFYALAAAISVAAAGEGGDLMQFGAKRGPVVYFAAEDPEPAIIRRLHSFGAHLSAEARQAVADMLFVEPVLGRRLDVMNPLHAQAIIDRCAGARLIVFDTLSRVHTLDENSNGDMARLVSQFEYIGAQTGASILYLHHVSKSSVRDGVGDQQQAGRGASALIDNARWCGFITKMTEKEAEQFSDRRYDAKPIGAENAGRYLRFGISKQNYDTPQPDRWLERRAGGVLMPIDLRSIGGSSNAKITKKVKKAEVGDSNEDDNW